MYLRLHRMLKLSLQTKYHTTKCHHDKMPRFQCQTLKHIPSSEHRFTRFHLCIHYKILSISLNHLRGPSICPHSTNLKDITEIQKYRTFLNITNMLLNGNTPLKSRIMIQSNQILNTLIAH